MGPHRLVRVLTAQSLTQCLCALLRHPPPYLGQPGDDEPDATEAPPES